MVKISWEEYLAGGEARAVQGALEVGDVTLHWRLSHCGAFRGSWQRRFWHGVAGHVAACRRFGERLCQLLGDTPHSRQDLPRPDSRGTGRRG